MIAKLLILIARGWQLGPSLILPPSCRYNPSCSAYAIEALRRYGAAKAAGWPSGESRAAIHGAATATILCRDGLSGE